VGTEGDTLEMVWVLPAQRYKPVSFHSVYIFEYKGRIFNGVLYLSTYRTTHPLSVYVMY
jgi:hypothetical protein